MKTIFLEYLINKSNSIRKLGLASANSNYFYGYYRGLKYLVDIYMLLVNPGKDQMIDIIKKEIIQVKKTRSEEPDELKKKRSVGCLQCFIDVLNEIDKVYE
jgi:hypothetical protein